MNDRDRFYRLDELRRLSPEALRDLWERIPPERRRAYRDAYEREVRTAGAEGSDARERAVAVELLRRYHNAALVPLGSRWARTPSRLRDAAREGVRLDTPEDSGAAGRPSAKVGIGLAVVAVVLLALVFLRTGRPAAAVITPVPTDTPVSATPTPLALDAPDAVIGGGDQSRAAAYPITLQVTMPDRRAPRVWVVQRRLVHTATWNYDPNPDTASFLSGMSVRPVIGIPYSADNAAWFDAIGAGAEFTLQMNTGAIRRYQFADKQELRRSDTDLFRQIAPGLALLLIGQTDTNGLPTVTRTLITADYPPEQELSRLGNLVDPATLPTTAPTVTPIPVTVEPLAELDVQVISVTYGGERLTVRLRLYNGGSQTAPLTSDDLQLALGYVPDPPGPQLPADALTPFDLLPGQAADLTLIWPWHGEPFGVLRAGAYQFALELPAPR